MAALGSPAAPNFTPALRLFARYRLQNELARRPRLWWKRIPTAPEFTPPVVRVYGYRKGANGLAGSEAGDNATGGSVKGG